MSNYKIKPYYSNGLWMSCTAPWERKRSKSLINQRSKPLVLSCTTSFVQRPPLLYCLSLLDKTILRLILLTTYEKSFKQWKDHNTLCPNFSFSWSPFSLSLIHLRIKKEPLPSLICYSKILFWVIVDWFCFQRSLFSLPYNYGCDLFLVIQWEKYFLPRCHHRVQDDWGSFIFVYVSLMICRTIFENWSNCVVRDGSK